LIAEDEARSAKFMPILAIPPCMTFLIAEWGTCEVLN
jgi:hypothetical protein